jgi:SAM-dependent methyltransferase
MENLMININWEKPGCHICHSKFPPRSIKLKGKPLTDGQFGYSVHPVICKCGLVFLSPRWGKKNYGVFYENYYDDLYRLESKPDIGVAGVIKNMAIIWSRIKEFISQDIENVLDVGCGSGYGLKYLKEQNPQINIYGIESSPDCSKTLESEEIGGKLFTSDFEDDWAKKHVGEMDLIILRHSIEHMLKPVETLKKINRALSDEGLIYVATPDMMHPRTKLRDYLNWWEYWFRAVHPYYYSKETLFRTLELANIYPNVFGEENEEVWCLAGKNKKNRIDYDLDSLFERQVKILNKYLP